MRSKAFREVTNVEVAKCDIFATPNSLKLLKPWKLKSPLLQRSCRDAKVVDPQ